jgi:hypothetical protein
MAQTKSWRSEGPQGSLWAGPEETGECGGGRLGILIQLSSNTRKKDTGFILRWGFLHLFVSPFFPQ